MTENKTEVSEEKEILEILGEFETKFKQKNQDSKREIQSVRYYEEFAVKGMQECIITGIFVTEEIDGNGKISYHVYYRDSSDEILSIDSEGNIQINPEWKQAIGHIDFKKSMEINNQEPERLKGISEKATSKEISKKLKEEKGEEPEKNPEEQIQHDLGGKEDLGITYYRPIKDNSFDEQIGMDLSEYEEIGLAYSEKQNAFIFVGEKDGKFQQVEGFEPAQPTFKTVMSIDEKGEKVTKEVPHALMQTNNPEKELSISIEQYGYIEVGTVDRLPCEKRVKRQVGEQGEGDGGRTNLELNRVIREKGTAKVDDYAEAKDGMTVEQTSSGNVSNEIANAGELPDGNDLIPDTNITWREFANACGYRGEGDIELAQDRFEEEKIKTENEGKTNQEIVDDFIRKKEAEYMRII